VRSESLAAAIAQTRAVLNKVGYPKVTVLTVERYADKGGALSYPPPVVGAIAEDALLKYGFDLIGKGKPAPVGNEAVLFAELDALTTGRTQAAAKEGADVIVTARADDRFTGYGELGDNNYYASALVTLRAVDTRNGTVLASFERTGKGIGANPELARQKAVRSVAQDCADKLITGMLAVWQQQLDRGQHFELVVAKVKSYAKVARPLLKALEQSGKFAQVKEAGFAGDELQIEVLFKGDKQALLDALFDDIAAQKTFAKLSKQREDGNRLFLSF
jgi:hypothetical protein